MAQGSQIIMLGMGPGNNLLQFFTCGLGADTAPPVIEPPSSGIWTPQTATAVTWTPKTGASEE